MYIISKKFWFSGAHQLDHLPEDHKCARLHGHNWCVEVLLRAGHLDADGFVLDYGNLAPFKAYIDTTFDHRFLNEVLGDGRLTTAENLARHFYEWCERKWPGYLYAVRVHETPKTMAEYRISA